VRTLELRSNVRVRGILSEAVSKAVGEDLSSQAITPSKSIITYEDKSSSLALLSNPRTPTLVPRFGVLAKIG